MDYSPCCLGSSLEGEVEVESEIVAVVLTPGHGGLPDRRPHNVLRVRGPHRDTQKLQTSHGHHRYLAIMSSTSIYTIAIIWKPSILNT